MRQRTRTILLMAVSVLLSDTLLAQGPYPIAGGRFEASGVIGVPGTNGALFVDDAQTGNILWMELTADGMQKGDAVPVPLPGVEVVDLEGMTHDGTHFYAVGSQSKEIGYDGDGLIRFSFDAATRQVGQVESIRELKKFLAQHVPELCGVDQRAGDEALNIEAIAWDPARNRILLGLRAPVVAADALVVPLKLRDANGPFSVDNLMVDGKGAIRLPLDGAGLRSLEFDYVTGKFLLFTGAALNDENTDFRLLEWDGTSSQVPREIGRYSRKLKPEGITRLRLAGREATLIVFDVGRYEVLRPR